MWTAAPNSAQWSLLALAALLVWCVEVVGGGPSALARPLSAAQQQIAGPEFERLARLAQEARDAERLLEAVDLYRQALELKPDWDEGHWSLGTLLYSLDRYAEGRDVFRELTARRPDHGPSWAFLGLCELQQRDYARALDDLQKARMHGVGDNRLLVNVVRYNLATLLTRFEKFEDAYQLLQGFAQEYNEDPNVVEALGLCTLQMPFLPEELPPDRRDLVLAAGRAAYQMAIRRMEEADRLYRELVARYPSVPNVRYAYGYFLIQHDTERAMEEFRQELRNSPSHVYARLQLTSEYVRRGDFAAARPYAEEAARISPGMPSARYLLGRTLLELGELEGATRELEAAVKLAPEAPEIHFALARAYARLGRKDEAARARAEFARLDRIQRERREGPQAVGGVEPGGNRPPKR